MMKIKVVERKGISLRDILPGLKEECCGNDKEKCFIHMNDGRGNCRTEGVVYKSECLTCLTKGPDTVPPDKVNKIKKQPGVKSIYIGETSRSGYQRGTQHQKAIKKPNTKQNRKNAFGKHINEFHKGNKNVKFKTSVIGSFQRPMQRQIAEGVNIYRSKPKCDILMNSKMDYYKPAIARVNITNNIDE